MSWRSRPLRKSSVNGCHERKPSALTNSRSLSDFASERTRGAGTRTRGGFDSWGRVRNWDVFAGDGSGHYPGSVPTESARGVPCRAIRPLGASKAA